MLDLTGIDLTKSGGLSGSQGVYLKYKDKDNYYKFSTFDPYFGFIGFESFNEVIAGRLGKILGINVLQQTLVRTKVVISNKPYITYACKSISYKKPGEVRVYLPEYFKKKGIKGSSIYEAAINAGFKDFLNTLFIWDYLIIGRDRHSGNVELLAKGRKIRFAPIFDNGVSLLAPITYGIPKNSFKEKVLHFRELDDYMANNFIGYRSLNANLSLVTNPIYINKLLKEHKKSIFYGMNSILPSFYIDKLWSIICYRYSYLRRCGYIVEK